MRPTRIAIGLLLVAGCATSLEARLGTWAKPGGTARAADRDSRECQAEAIYGLYDPSEPHMMRGKPPSTVQIDMDTYAVCMKERGYRRLE